MRCASGGGRCREGGCGPGSGGRGRPTDASEQYSRFQSACRRAKQQQFLSLALSAASNLQRRYLLNRSCFPLAFFIF